MKGWAKNLSFFLVVIAVLSITGCDEAPSVPTIDEVTRAVEQKVDDISDKIHRKTESTDDLKYISEGDLEKLFRVEYHVEEHPADIPGGELQSRLATLGLERWQCNVTFPPPSGKLRLLCQRPPLGLVRLLARAFPFIF